MPLADAKGRTWRPPESQSADHSVLSGKSAAVPAIARSGFIARLDLHELARLDELGDPTPFDAAIVNASYLATGKQQSSLPAELIRQRLAAWDGRWFLDPATPELADEDVRKKLKGKRRLETVYAKALPLPLRAETFADANVVEAFVGAGQQLQLTADAFTIPYFEVPARSSAEHEANVAMIKIGKQLAGRRRLVSFAQVKKALLHSGELVEIALDHHQAGADWTMIRVRKLKPQELSADTAYEFIEALGAISDAGGRPIADCAGRFGPIAIEGGAWAFTSGSKIGRKVADKLCASDGMATSSVLEAPDELFGVTPGNVLIDLRPCREANCPAEGGRRREGWKPHALHEFRNLGRLALAGELIPLLRQSRGVQAAVWAEALERQRSQAASKRIHSANP